MLGLFLLSLLSSRVYGAVHERWYNISHAIANPDGLFERRVVGVNGTWPPPILEVGINDTVIIHAYNGMPDQTASVHHHGMFFNGTTYYDGAVGITQCGIPTGETFTYNFTIDNQHGTYWWHAHSHGQYVDGLRAPFIIHNNVESYSYDGDYTVNMGDWYHDSHEVLLAEFLNQYNPTGAEPVPKSGLIYYSVNSTYLPGFNENSTMTFEAGKTYRLRLINMSALAMFEFWIDGHNMTIVEVDGVDTEPYEVSQIAVAAAQRYSVLVTALNSTENNYAVHANMNPDMFDGVPDDLQLNITSTLAYSNSSDAPLIGKDSTVDEYVEVLDMDLIPLDVEGTATPDVDINLTFNLDTADDGINRGFFNGVTFQNPRTPAMFTALTMGDEANSPAVYGQTNTFVVQHGQMVQFTIFNEDVGMHPFHLHGHKFQIVHKSWNVSSDDPEVNPPMNETQVNPARRDTVLVPPGGSATMRFRADNPGSWLMHCHIEWHLQAGLAAVFQEAPLQLQQLPAPPSFVADQCLMQNSPVSGNAAGHNSTTDFSGMRTGPWPQVLGWHAKGIGALAGAILTAILGMLSVIWYVMGGQLDEDEVAIEAELKMKQKAKKGNLAQRIRGMAQRIG